MFRPLPPGLSLAPGEAHVFRFQLDVDGARLAALRAVLNASEQARVDRLMFSRDRDRMAAARALCRVALGQVIGADPRVLAFEVAEYGKPFLVDYAQVRFNLSHSQDRALLAVMLDHEVGVDLEAHRPDVDRDSIARRFFSPGEWQALAALPPADQPAAFFDVWARKEAYIKGRGLGLKIPLTAFTIGLGPGAGLLSPDPLLPPGERWALYALDAGPAFAAALAVEGGAEKICLWDFAP